MPGVDPDALHCKTTQGADDHLRVLVSVKGSGGTNDAVVDIAFVVEDGTPTRSSSYQQHLRHGRRRSERREVHFHPRVLIPPDDDAWPVTVEEENGGVRRCLLQKVVLDGQVDVRVQRAGDVDLTCGSCFRDELGE